MMNDNVESYEPIIDILEEILGEHRGHSEYKHQISFDCPVCSYEIKGLDEGDGKGNLEINYQRGVYKCWACYETNNTYGKVFSLIKKYGSPKLLKKYQLLMPHHDEAPKKKYKPVILPKEFISFNNVSAGLKLTHYYKQAFNYIKKRNISEEQIKKYNIGFCYDGHYSNRIIIPSYDKDKKLNYFIARSYLEKTKFKYKNPETEKETLIWNEHLIDWNKPVYIVEGVFDSIFIDNSIPLLGKHLGDYLFYKIYDNAKEVIIILDGDAWNDATILYHKLNCGKLMGKVKIIKLPVDKDIADLQGKLDEFKILELD